MTTAPPRSAVRQARTATFWGQRRREAAQQGPVTELATAVDHLRATIARLPESQRSDATRRAVQLLDDLRQAIADQ